MLKKSLQIIGCLITIATVAVFYAYLIFYGSGVEREHILYLPSNISYEKVVDSLKPYIKHHTAFDIYAKRINLSNSYKSGCYLLEPDMSVIEVARMIKLGVQEPIDLTINNVRLISQLASKLSQRIEADSVDLMQAFSSVELLKEVGFTPQTLLSMFIPNTYEVYWSITPEEFVRKMHREYNRFWTPERDAKRKRLNLSRLKVMTLASIIYEETAKNDEMATIAGVYLNRLRIGMPLQADPTVKYAMQDFDLRRVLFAHLKYDSPYNTYMYRGVPPSPICMPSIAAIDAVLNPEKHSYLYFCARPTFDGYHSFARTLSEHNANSRKYSAELNRRNIK